MGSFIAAAVLLIVAGLPIMTATRVAPRMEGRPSARLLVFVLLAPVAMLLNLTHGATIELFLTFLHLYTDRSEEHTSELQSLMRNSYAVFCLKKKKYEFAQHKRLQHAILLHNQ